MVGDLNLLAYHTLPVYPIACRTGVLGWWYRWVVAGHDCSLKAFWWRVDSGPQVVPSDVQNRPFGDDVVTECLVWWR